jgi:hypothetical protein
MDVEGITWHAVTLDSESFASMRSFVIDVLGLSPTVDVPGFAMFAMTNGTILELYDEANVPLYGNNEAVAFGFHVPDIEGASAELEQAGCELLGEITRMDEINYAYRHFRAPDGRVYGPNEQK